MIFYGYCFAQGRALLSELLDASDPFALPPIEIVERVLATGCTPEVSLPSSEPHRLYGTVSRVERGDQVFLVAVSRDGEHISVQEEREDAYETDE